MLRAAIVPAFLMLTACATAPADAQRASASAPAYRAIAFEIKTWGRTAGSWSVEADGTVRHQKIDGSVFNAHRVEHREFTIDAAAYAQLAAIAAELPQPRLDRSECEERATDLPYGAVRLTNGKGEEEVPFDSGCLDAPYRAFMGRVRAMDDLVAAWAERHPASRVEQVAGG